MGEVGEEARCLNNILVRSKGNFTTRVNLRACNYKQNTLNICPSPIAKVSFALALQ